MKPDSGKTLLAHYNKTELQAYLRDENFEPLTLPVPSPLPFAAASPSQEVYTKVDFSPNDSKHRLRCIKENGKTHSFVWLTTGEKLKEGIRFGIIQPDSLSGKIIATLGQYRLSTHERVVKGMMTKTQAIKLKLLDHYQDRIELLEPLESLVNQSNDLATYTAAFTAYLKQIENLQGRYEELLENSQLEQILPGTLTILNEELEQSKARAKKYLEEIKSLSSLAPANRARGVHSILEFVKQESLQLLYEFQGLNQDFSFSRARHFALTRGELNDAIEDARQVIDRHRADPKNTITSRHHLDYPAQETVAFHFDPDRYSPNLEKQALMAVCFIEGWSQFDPDNQQVINDQGKAAHLDTITATKWQQHRNWWAFIKSFGHFILNIFKGIVMPTQPWHEETWDDPEFHLFSKTLLAQSRPNQHIWWGALHLLKKLGLAIYDIVNGIRDFAVNLAFHLPKILHNDWESTKTPLPLSEEFYQDVKAEIDELVAEELKRLDTVFTEWAKKTNLPKPKTLVEHGKLPPLAHAPYPLTAGEQNDLLTSVVRGLDGFASFFTHNIYSKDPVGGLIFTLAYAWGGVTLLFPSLSQALFGQAYVAWFTEFAKTMGGTTLSQIIAAGSTNGQGYFWAWDMLMHGPKSTLASTTEDILNDPITVAAIVGLAYGVGYVLVNHIPALGEEVGTVPDTTYILTGLKALVGAYEFLETPHHSEIENIKKAMDKITHENPGIAKELARIRLIFWLHEHAESLPKLDRATKFKIEQQINTHCNTEDARALKTILYPEHPRSIAAQLFYIPLSYIPALLRIGSALCMGVVAAIQHRPNPWAPIQRAGRDLLDMAAYDINRVFIFTHELLRLLFKCIACVFKATAFSGNLLIGRIGGLCKAHPGHFIHLGFAAIHRGFAWIREALFMAQAAEHVVTRDARCTLELTTQSYAKLQTDLLAKPQPQVPLAPANSGTMWTTSASQPPTMDSLASQPS